MSHKRWFRLDQKELSWFSKEGSEKQNGSVPLAEIDDVRFDENQRTISVVNKGQTLKLEAQNEEDYLLWSQGLNRAVNPLDEVSYM